jgi:hypothetical protein
MLLRYIGKANTIVGKGCSTFGFIKNYDNMIDDMSSSAGRIAFGKVVSHKENNHLLTVSGSQVMPAMILDQHM